MVHIDILHNRTCTHTRSGNSSFSLETEYHSAKFLSKSIVSGSVDKGIDWAAKEDEKCYE